MLQTTRKSTRKKDDRFYVKRVLVRNPGFYESFCCKPGGRVFVRKHQFIDGKWKIIQQRKLGYKKTSKTRQQSSINRP